MLLESSEGREGAVEKWGEIKGNRDEKIKIEGRGGLAGKECHFQVIACLSFFYFPLSLSISVSPSNSNLLFAIGYCKRFTI